MVNDKRLVATIDQVDGVLDFGVQISVPAAVSDGPAGAGAGIPTQHEVDVAAIMGQGAAVKDICVGLNDLIDHIEAALKNDKGRSNAMQS